MRHTKIVSALVALVLAISLAGLVASPAQAVKPKHDLVAQGGKSAGGQLFIAGKVSTLPNKKVTIQRKLKGQVFKAYKQGPTNGKGKFRVNVDGPIGACFKIIAPETKNYRRTSLAGKSFCIVAV
jgi:hypothetical protein